MQYFPIFLLTVIGLFLITRPLTVLFHELGHAIPAILLTKQKTTIYIGSYGDPKKSIKINLGILAIFFRYNPFAWRLGLCVPSAKSISINRQIVYTLTGPLASLIIATTACYFAFAYNLHGFLKLFLIVFLGSAFLDFLVNLIPSETPIKLSDGRSIYNDGYSLKQLFYYKRLPKEYSEAVDLYNEQKFASSAVLFERLLCNTKDENIYRLAISAYLQDKNYKKAKEISDTFLLTEKMNSDDLSNIALSYSELGFHDEAMKFYNKSLQLNPDNKYSLNNKGYTLNLMGEYEEAISFFDRAVELDREFAYSYNNRGLAKIKSGKIEEGLQDINRSIELDPSNSYAYRNLGIYHFDKGEFDDALKLFTRAKKLDDTTHMIDQLIKYAKEKIVGNVAGNSAVKKIIYLFLVFFMTACVSYKKHNQQEILNQKLDFDGRVVTKTFRQWISHPAGDRLATITQEFDSFGRVVKEYGFNNPYHYNQKYLEEKLYRGNYLYILNRFLWPKGDTTSDFSNYKKQLDEELIYTDSLNKKKSITITLWPINGDTLVGHFEETFPISVNSWTSNSFSFRIHKNDLQFDDERKLIVGNLKK